MSREAKEVAVFVGAFLFAISLVIGMIAGYDSKLDCNPNRIITLLNPGWRVGCFMTEPFK